MIRLQDYTPEVYYKQSRDFQFIGRLYDVVLNAVKTNSDMLYSIPAADAAGSDLIDLLVLTLGFKNQHNYNIKQLSAICSIFPTILKNKGSKEAIELTCQTLLTAEGINDTVTVDVKDNVLYIYISQQLTDLSLLRDILNYILPAGLSCQIIRASANKAATATTELSSTDNVNYWKTGSSDLQSLTSMLVELRKTLRNAKLDGFSQFEDKDGKPGIVAEDLEGAAANSAVIGKQED